MCIRDRTYGLILVFEELRSLIWGDDVHGVAVPALLNASISLTENLSYPVYRLAISGVCLLLAAALYFLIQKTRLGMMIRAGASNRDMVQSLGIDIKLIYTLVFALGVALAAFAAAPFAPPNAPDTLALLDLINRRVKTVKGVRQVESFVYFGIHTHRFGWGVR